MSFGYISRVGINLICEFEGFRANAYPDVGGVWTIGYGTTRIDGKPVTKGMTCTEEQAKQWMSDDCAELNYVVSQLDQHKKLTQWQFDACVSFGYNVGPGALLTSTLGRKIRVGNIDSITEANFTSWNKVRNSHNVLVESKGLTRRRRAEWHLFNTGQIKTQF